MGGTIEDLRRRWPQWHIERIDDPLSGHTYTARPFAEQARPPVWEHAQLLRGLTSRVENPDLGELERKISEQDRLRRQMAEWEELPFDGRTYVDAEPTGRRFDG